MSEGKKNPSMTIIEGKEDVQAEGGTTRCKAWLRYKETDVPPAPLDQRVRGVMQVSVAHVSNGRFDLLMFPILLNSTTTMGWVQNLSIYLQPS
jgi:hypothetical protein